jgi:S-adenosylmethionine decarboxylase
VTHIPPAGLHLIVDIETEVNLTNVEAIRAGLERAAHVCGATVIGCTMHHFGEGAGVTGVLLLAESHISIHTWPELKFAAVDIFMCGSCDPHGALPVLRELFASDKLQVRSIARRSVL